MDKKTVSYYKEASREQFKDFRLYSYPFLSKKYKRKNDKIDYDDEDLELSLSEIRKLAERNKKGVKI